MAYKTTTGSIATGDIKYEDDQTTLIDFESSVISLKTSNIARLEVTNNHVSASVNLSASALFGDGSGLTSVPLGDAKDTDTAVQFNSGSEFSGSTNCQFLYGAATPQLKVTGEISASNNILCGNDIEVTGNATFSGSLRAKQVHIIDHNWAINSMARVYLPIGNEVENTAPGYQQHMVAPFDGKLLRVYFRSTNDQSGGSVIFTLHTGVDGQATLGTGPVETVTIATGSDTNTVMSASFTGSGHFVQGDIIGIAIESSANDGNANATSVWEFDILGI